MLPRADAWIPRPTWTLHLHRWPYSWWAVVEPHSAPPGLLMIIRQHRPLILAIVALHTVALLLREIGFDFISPTAKGREEEMNAVFHSILSGHVGKQWARRGCNTQSGSRETCDWNMTILRSADFNWLVRSKK